MTRSKTTPPTWPQGRPAGGARSDRLAVRDRVADLVGAVTNPEYEPGRDKHEQYREHVAASLEASPAAGAAPGQDLATFQSRLARRPWMPRARGGVQRCGPGARSAPLRISACQPFGNWRRLLAAALSAAAWLRWAGVTHTSSSAGAWNASRHTYPLIQVCGPNAPLTQREGAAALSAATCTCTARLTQV